VSWTARAAAPSSCDQKIRRLCDSRSRPSPSQTTPALPPMRSTCIATFTWPTAKTTTAPHRRPAPLTKSTL
ncbi:unnamed protein product, partial [Lampetra fluviatilis]